MCGVGHMQVTCKSCDILASTATKPLLRQLENLQSVHSTQAANWDRIEASLTERLTATQSQLQEVEERERDFTEKEMVLQKRVTVLENQVKVLRQEKATLTASLDLETSKVSALEEKEEMFVVPLYWLACPNLDLLCDAFIDCC